MKNNIKKSNSSYHRWKWFSYSYLALVEIGLKKLREEINHPSNVKDIKHYFVFCKKYLFIPIIYNLKHALEIILKGLNIQGNNGYIQTHDIMLNNNALQSIINESTDNQNINTLIDIINKYYRMEFFNKILVQKIKISDIHNDIFRFPENSVKFSLDSECFGRLKKQEINEFIDELEKDIALLFKLLITISEDISDAKKI